MINHVINVFCDQSRYGEDSIKNVIKTSNQHSSDADESMRSTASLDLLENPFEEDQHGFLHLNLMLLD